MSSWYRGQSIYFATAHHKDTLFAKAFAETLGAKVLACAEIDTDQFGTFSGEVARDPDLKAVLKKKALLGQQLSGCPRILASEGSFSQHPLIPDWATNQEVVYFMDQDRGVELFLARSTHLTSFSARVLQSEPDLWNFAESVGFPQQALLMRSVKGGGPILKGLESIPKVQKAWRQLRVFGDVLVETDNRAHLNPQRRQFLSLVAQELAEIIATVCPGCQGPGFHLTGTERGLPCRDCGSPTALVQTELWSCGSHSCLHEERRARLDGLVMAEPRDCDLCNP